MMLGRGARFLPWVFQGARWRLAGVSLAPGRTYGAGCTGSAVAAVSVPLAIAISALM